MTLVNSFCNSGAICYFFLSKYIFFIFMSFFVLHHFPCDSFSLTWKPRDTRLTLFSPFLNPQNSSCTYHSTSTCHYQYGSRKKALHKEQLSQPAGQQSVQKAKNETETENSHLNASHSMSL